MHTPCLPAELKGKLNGLAIRVPLLNGSLTDCVFEVERGTSVEEVNALLKVRAARHTAACCACAQRTSKLAVQERHVVCRWLLCLPVPCVAQLPQHGQGQGLSTRPLATR